MASNEELYDIYLRAVSARDHDERLRLLTQCAMPDFEMVSPAYVARGTETVATKLGALAAARPDGVLRLRRASPLGGRTTPSSESPSRTSMETATSRSGECHRQTRDGRLARLLVFAPTELPSASSSWKQPPLRAARLDRSRGSPGAAREDRASGYVRRRADTPRLGSH